MRSKIIKKYRGKVGSNEVADVVIRLAGNHVFAEVSPDDGYDFKVDPYGSDIAELECAVGHQVHIRAKVDWVRHLRVSISTDTALEKLNAIQGGLHARIGLSARVEVIDISARGDCWRRAKDLRTVTGMRSLKRQAGCEVEVYLDTKENRVKVDKMLAALSKRSASVLSSFADKGGVDGVLGLDWLSDD